MTGEAGATRIHVAAEHQAELFAELHAAVSDAGGDVRERDSTDESIGEVALDLVVSVGSGVATALVKEAFLSVLRRWRDRVDDVDAPYDWQDELGPG